MGTYTTNKNLFMPSVGETGWGDLVNGNFETIDNFLKPITESGGTYTFTGNHVGNQSGGSVSATTGTFSGAVTATSFNGLAFSKTTPFVVNVSPSSTWFKVDGGSTSFEDLIIIVLPFNPFVVYTGSITVKGNSDVVIINADNTRTQKSYSSNTTVSFNNARMFAMATSGGWFFNDNIYTVPIFSF